MNIYHGSAYNHNKLQPGFNHSKILVKWDTVENNKWLYGTTDKNQAILLGLASSIEKKYDIKEFHNSGAHIKIVSYNKVLPKIDLKDITVYLYTCEKNGDWVKNNNQYNKIDTEYKTQKTITPLTIEIIDIDAWMVEHRYTLELVYPNKPGSSGW